MFVPSPYIGVAYVADVSIATSRSSVAPSLPRIAQVYVLAQVSACSQVAVRPHAHTPLKRAVLYSRRHDAAILAHHRVHNMSIRPDKAAATYLLRPSRITPG